MSILIQLVGSFDL